MYNKLFAFFFFCAYTTKNYSQATCISGDCQNGYGTSIEDDGRNWEGNWKNGYWFGYGVLTYPNGKILLGYWNNGVLDTSKIFDLQSNPYNKFNKDGLPEGLWITFHPKVNAPYNDYSGNPNHIKTIGRFRNGKNDGRWLYYSDAFVIKEEYYDNGEKDGTWITYWDDGYIGYDRVALIENYINGALNGLYQEYSHYGNVVILECNYINDQKVGEELEYYRNNILGQEEQENFKRLFKAKRRYTRGVLDGECFFYREDGALIGKEIYDMGILKHRYTF